MTGQLEVISDEDCRVLLEGGRVGRVAVTADALPVIAPVNYVVEGNNIVFRTKRDGMLSRACNDAVIAFEIDELADDGSGGWSVNVVGIASLAGDSEQVRLLGLRLVTAAGEEREQFVRMRMGLIHGQRISADVSGRALH
ncbi:MAG TPA: pyridoxamine 5'-phosphate oxidase family protein [Mycobacteriales bacterium]|nr:pyridoxamine 5'-phosphate oxidase family protein [Mycobacteriales bacterium]